MATLENLKDLVAADAGISRRWEQGKCAHGKGCHGDGTASKFTDALSVKEYGISGLCQACQDYVFAEPPEEDHQPADEPEPTPESITAVVDIPF